MTEFNDLQFNNTPEKNINKISALFLELLRLAVFAIITIALIKVFLFRPFIVKGQSMEPNFFEKDYLIIDELTYRFSEPKRGDVIVFRSPVSDDYYLKRIIGLPGERIQIGNNKVIIYNDKNPEGFMIDEFYLTEPTPGIDSVNLGPDQYYVMGDNRDASYDSRRFGAISRDRIIGRVILRGLPFNRITIFKHIDFNNKK